MTAHCRCTPMPLNSATAPAYTADPTKMATSQPRPIVASDPGAASPGGSSPPLRSDLKASRDAHIPPLDESEPIPRDIRRGAALRRLAGSG